MLPFGIGFILLVGYILFEHRFPKRPVKPVDIFELDHPLIYGENHINNPCQADGPGDLTFYNFICRIVPCKARLKDLSFHDIKVPNDFIIHQFQIAVKPDNTVEYLYLGPEQYHADKCPIENCLFLGDLKGEVLTEDLMKSIMVLMLTYDLDNPMNTTHWDNSDFNKSNQSVLAVMTA